MKLEMKDIKEDMIKWRRDLHQIPELELELPQTVAYVSNVLDELKIPYHYLVNGNAIVGEIKGEKKSDKEKVFALRADMDGLPIVEDTGLAFASTNGNMHACGHDGHTAMLLGASKYLMSRRDEISGTIKLFFQPGEEKGGGAKHMVDEGALKNPDVDAIFGLHEGNVAIESKHGEMMFKKGAMMASADSFDIVVEGKGTHAAYPNRGIDPITIASELILEIQRMRAREISPNETAVISVTSIHGGSAYNIIPEKVELKGTIRAFSKDIRNFIIKRLQEICEGMSISTRSKISMDYGDSYPPTINDEDFTEFAYEVAKSLHGEAVKYMKDGVMGGEDMSFFLEKVPGTYAFLVNPKKIDGVEYPHHHPKFDVDENLFEMGALTLAKVAINYLNN